MYANYLAEIRHDLSQTTHSYGYSLETHPMISYIREGRHLANH
jgi:hypothetical protein